MPATRTGLVIPLMQNLTGTLMTFSATSGFYLSGPFDHTITTLLAIVGSIDQDVPKLFKNDNLSITHAELPVLRHVLTQLNNLQH